MASKRAVLIGCNYPGTKAELKGCVNDVMRMHECLLNRYGFSEEDITILIDTDSSYTQPTGKNIRLALSRLVSSASPGSGDLLFVHYSGHGTRLPAESGDDDDTGYDECIVPCDMNLITDEDFRSFVDKVPEGCYITIVSDSCHSGGLIDEAKEQIGESTGAPQQSGSNEDQPSFGFSSILQNVVGNALETRELNFGLLKPRDHKHRVSHEEVRELPEGGTGHVRSRSLPLSTLIEILQQKTGKQDINVGMLRNTLCDLFGDDASPKVKMVMNVIMTHIGGDKKGGLMGTVGSLANQFFQQKLDGSSQGQSAMAAPVRMKPEAAGSAKRGLPENGILISGCQSDQTSADATPSGNPKGAYGALSNAIQTILSEADGPVTNHELVSKARQMLKKQGFTQRPGLYCGDANVDSPFVC